MTTIDTLTDCQIRTLRGEAMAAGDYAQVDICQRALTSDDDTIDSDGNEIAGADMSQDDARRECARVIATAAAQQD